MKREYLILKGALSVSLIVLLLGVAVNHRISTQTHFGKTQVADGVPLPPPIQPPPKLDAGVLVADGVPLPPPIQPPPKLNADLMADGVPLPPPIQPPPKPMFT
jgi:hypothetical protein